MPTDLVPTTRQGAAAASAVPVFALHGITKSFGPTLANDGIDLAMSSGGVIGLIGGNGAGKSTLMRILCGVTLPDDGRMEVDGRPVAWEHYGPEAAHRLGIRIVHQELSLCGNLSVAENFFLERPDFGVPLPGWRQVYRTMARANLEEVFPDHGIDVDSEVEDLPIGQRQMVEIARAASDPRLRLLILDEPTSSLDVERSGQLRSFIQRRRAEGLSFVFISHRLGEILDVCSDLCVLRNGRLAWSGEAAGASYQGLVQAMGGAAGQELRRERRARSTRNGGQILARIEGDATAALGRPIELRAGEIVGLAGLEGNGQKVMLHRLFRGGADRGATAKASFVAGDRQREGVFPLWSVLQNIGISRDAIRRDWEMIADKVEASAIRPLAERLRLDPGRFKAGILELSGGNQQKALVARALATPSPMLLLDDPTRGVDIGAKSDFYRAVLDAADAGRLIVWHSTENLEFLECDRVLVFRDGRIVRELVGEEISEGAIVDASFVEVGKGGERTSGRERQARLGRRMVGAMPFLALALVLAVMAWVNPLALSAFGLDLLLSSAVALVLISMAQMFVVGGSEIDLGVGAFAGMANVVSATLLVDRPWLGCAVLAAAWLGYGLLAAIIRMRQIPAIVVTLGASFIWFGIGFSLQPTPGGASPEWLAALFTWSIEGVPTTLVLILFISAVALSIDRSPVGVTLRAFGNNAAALERQGWSPLVYAMLRYLIAGAFALVAGLSLTAINAASDVNSGGPFTLLSVAAVVMGGCSLMGGRISAAGVAAGALTLSLVGALLGTLNVSTDLNAAVQGGLLLLILIMRTLMLRSREAA